MWHTITDDQLQFNLNDNMRHEFEFQSKSTFESWSTWLCTFPFQTSFAVSVVFLFWLWLFLIQRDHIVCKRTYLLVTVNDLHLELFSHRQTKSEIQIEIVNFTKPHPIFGILQKQHIRWSPNDELPIDYVWLFFVFVSCVTQIECYWYYLLSNAFFFFSMHRMGPIIVSRLQRKNHSNNIIANFFLCCCIPGEQNLSHIQNKYKIKQQFAV